MYATILTEGVAGNSPVGLITGATNIGQVKTLSKMQQVAGEGASYDMVTVGAEAISLGDILSEPSLALGTMANNFQTNLAPMAIAAFGTSITFRIGKRLLRRPISNINRNIMVPALGAGIRL